MKKWKLTSLVAILMLSFTLTGCNLESFEDSDRRVEREQEKQMKEAFAETGLPAIINFQEKKLMKMIYELRDQENVVTYAYLYNEMTGKLVYLGKAVGYGLPYATQYSNPQKEARTSYSMPQPEPNGLFMPESAQATWLMLIDPETNEPRPVFVEPNLIISPFKLD